MNPYTLRKEITENVSNALREDIGCGDVTAELIPSEHKSRASVITRETCVVCGRDWFDEVFRQLDTTISIQWHAQEGQTVAANTKLVTLEGPSRVLLTGERTALNFLQFLSGIATKAQEYTQQKGRSRIRLLDTRKTIPGLRLAQKYAVTIGGCENHRIGLYDCYLIKENHITACGSITAAVASARKQRDDLPIVVEVETEEELQEALAAHVNRIMLDNFSISQLQHAMTLDKGNTLFEVSGNLTRQNISELANIGIDCLSAGDLTKNITSIDLSMRIVAIAP